MTQERLRSLEGSDRSRQPGGFVGRERELEQLRSGLSNTLAGRGQLFLVSGEPGIGKTRIADELSDLARTEGIEVAWGRCWEGGGAPAYWPWAQVLRSLAARSGSENLAGLLRQRIAQITSSQNVEVTDHSGAAPAPADLPSISGRAPESERFRLFDSLQALLRETSESTPLLIVLDDCHAADPASLSLLKFVARDLRQSRIFVLATYRELEVRLRPELTQAFAELGREGNAIALRGISESDVDRFLESVAGEHQRDSVAAALYRATEGNPFFLNEIVRLLLAEGRLDSVTTATLGEFKLPETVRGAIRRGLALVSPATRSVMSSASVIGREFDLALLRRLSTLSDEELRDAIAQAEGRGLVTELPGTVDRYRFSHALIPETLYEDLPRPECRQLHGRIGAAMEELYSTDLDSHFSELAYHLVEALPFGTIDAAVSYSARAAARADALLAYEESARLYGLALKALESGARRNDARRCGLLLRLGPALQACGRFEESHKAFSEAATVAASMGDASRHASAVLGCAIIPSTPGAPNLGLIRMLEEAMGMLGESDSAERAMVMARLAEELLWSEDSERRTRLSAEAIEIARRLNDERALVDVLYRRHITLIGPETIGDRLRLSEEIISLIRRAGSGDAALKAHYLRIADLLEIGDIAAVDREIASYVQLAHELRQPSVGIADLMLAMRALMNGRLDDGEKLALSGFATGQSRRQNFATLILASQLALVRREQGRLAELEPSVRSFAEQYPAITFPRCGLAFCYTETGKRPEAAAEFERLTKGGIGLIQRDATWLASMILLTEICAELGDAVRAAELYRLLTPYSALNATLDVYSCWGSVAHYLGMLAATIGDLDRANEHFEAAVKFNLAMGSHLWVAHTRYRHAALLMARDRGDDVERALVMIELALATCDSLRLPTLAAKLRALREPDLSAEAGPDGTVSLLFSDIEASTPMTERLGDIRAQELIQEHRAIVREEVTAHQGFEVKTMGDGFMIAFGSARRALLCAIAIQRAFDTYNKKNAQTPIRISIGLHTGEAIKDSGDFYGKAVITASRIGSLARADEILVSSTFHELTIAAGDIHFGPGKEIELKGLGGLHRIYPVLWRE